MLRSIDGINLEKRVVLGIDECNNGMDLDMLPFICAGYSSKPPHKPLGNMVSKGKGFHKKPSYRIRFRDKALQFLRDHPTFEYFTIGQSKDQVFSNNLRAVATARLIYEQACTIGEEPVVILDGCPFSEFAEEKIGEALYQYGLNLEDIFFERRADANYWPVKIADRIAYCLGAIRFGGVERNKKWPHRHKKIKLNTPPTNLDEDQLFAFYRSLKS